MEINLQWELAFRLLFALIIGGLVGSNALHHKTCRSQNPLFGVWPVLFYDYFHLRIHRLIILPPSKGSRPFSRPGDFRMGFIGAGDLERRGYY